MKQTKEAEQGKKEGIIFQLSAKRYKEIIDRDLILIKKCEELEKENKELKEERRELIKDKNAFARRICEQEGKR